MDAMVISEANEDVSLGSWFIGLEVEHIDDRNMCCGTPPEKNLHLAIPSFSSEERKSQQIARLAQIPFLHCSSLKHQRKWKSDPNYTKSWYDRGAKICQAEKFKKGACEKYFPCRSVLLVECMPVENVANFCFCYL
ncbi:hypothetical protein ACSBR2_013849 [Camellia fascicularis]